LKRLARRRLLFETHELEYGFRKRIQGAIIKDDAVPKVFISKALYQRLCEHHGYAIQKSIILPDAAHAGVNRLQPQQKVNLRKEHLSSQDLDKYTYHAGYFGHLYSGRGIEIVQALAARHPEIAFWIYGGNDEQITLLKQRNNANNMKVMGYVNPSNVLEIMSMMDVLLMPYQKMVSIGGRNRSDTASYMSPMKMFEYMAAGVPIIASRLPVLEEILIDGQNCLMAVPDDPLSWSGCLDKIKGSEILSEKLAKTAHDEYRQRYTWNVRAQKMIDLIGK
jgi:glycosyltransferase involved in cell wall biosynthesis